MFLQIRQLISVIFKEVIRNPGIIFWAILFPVLMAWGLGIAFTKQDELIRNVAWIQNESGSSIVSTPGQIDSKSPTIKIGNDEMGRTTYKLLASGEEDAIAMMKRGKVTLILDESSGSLQYRFDPMNPEAQLAYYHFKGYLTEGDIKDKNAPLQFRPVTRQGARYIDFLVPGLIAFNIMMSCMWGISYSLIDKRIKKLLRRMVATPMKKSGFMIAQFVARLGLSGMEVLILVLFAWLYFNINIQGSIPGLLLLFVAGNIAFTGIAIFVSSRVSNTQVGNGLINLVVMPMMIVSGIFFSYHNFPDWAVAVIQWLPATLLADNVRSIFNEGATLFSVLPAILVLSLSGIAFFALGIRIYKWY